MELFWRRRKMCIAACLLATNFREDKRQLKVRFYTRAGTLAVRSSLPQLTHAPLTARRIAFQMQ